jgi:hypothetical protein
MQMTHSMMECCANNNLDMVYDWVLIRKEDVLSLEKHAEDLWIWFYHIYLNAPSDIWLNRVQERWFWWSLTEEKAIYFYEGLKELKNEVSMHEIDTSINIPEEVVQLIFQHSWA